ncbi:MAG TPA: nucleotide exchange factor GrpE [Anaerolineae bacterium]|jgi:molecular chaperone GrpE|nr:nucleotide exchange factor GrpE [Anaerolineae bacterium]
MADEEFVPSEAEQNQVTEADRAEDAKEATEAESEPTLEEQLAEAQAMAAEYLEGWQRARAEFANARKRLERERVEAYSVAAVDNARKLLPILDDLGRAMESAPSEIAQNQWFEGLDLVNRKLRTILEALDVQPIDALGQPFDPNYHEALALKEADGVESGVVIEELQIGYRLGERVIRPSLVNVSA